MVNNSPLKDTTPRKPQVERRRDALQAVLPLMSRRNYSGLHSLHHSLLTHENHNGDLAYVDGEVVLQECSCEPRLWRTAFFLTVRRTLADADRDEFTAIQIDVWEYVRVFGRRTVGRVA